MAAGLQVSTKREGPITRGELVQQVQAKRRLTKVALFADFYKLVAEVNPHSLFCWLLLCVVPGWLYLWPERNLSTGFVDYSVTFGPIPRAVQIVILPLNSYSGSIPTAGTAD